MIGLVGNGTKGLLCCLFVVFVARLSMLVPIFGLCDVTIVVLKLEVG